MAEGSETPETVAEFEAAPVAETAPPRRAPASPPRTESHPVPPPVPKGRAIYAALDKVELIITDLKEVLNELDLVMEYLEDVERQQITNEREIEMLRSRLESLHRRVDRPQHSPRRHEPRREPPRPQHQEEGPEADPS